jgi:Vacuolar sorting protein 9 (VPS9) domain/Ankyrin repeats (many copies)/PX domain
MPLLNPFLRALFQSSVLGQTIPLQNHVLLLPTTNSLLNARDRESGKSFADLVQDEEFLASHILRIPPSAVGKETNNVRDNRGKAKTFPTVNGRTVIIKENMVYSNKGFKNLTQAQFLSDVLYYSAKDTHQWLIYYISKPLVGSFEPVAIIPAVIRSHSLLPEPTQEASTLIISRMPKKKDIKTFGDLLNNFPMIARQMQPGLERLFNEFGKELGKPLPPPPSRISSTSSFDGSTQDGNENGSIHSNKTNGRLSLPFQSTEYFDDDEDLMRRALETAVTAAIDLFQLVDKQQLSFLGATTDLTGPAVERLIEKYIAEQVHDSLVFPKLCHFYRVQDTELDRRIRQMESLDVSQVGIAIEDGRRGKMELLARLDRGIAAFRKIGVAGGPQEMLKVLLETQKAISEAANADSETSGKSRDAEKRAASMTINADILVSLLLIVVIRSQIRHLQARLSYMQHFIYIDDVESGELGYALSTFEAVLSYLSKDAGGLRKAAQRNKRLWDAVKNGSVPIIRTLFESSPETIIADALVDEPGEVLAASISSIQSTESDSGLNGTINGEPVSPAPNLAHVFPFQIPAEPLPSTGKHKKRVKMVSRSLSISSAASFNSRATTIYSTLSGIEGDVSIESLAQTQDPSGNSVLMMAVESQQPQSLQFLLTLSDYFPPDVVLSDITTEGTTLLSAAIQLGHMELIDIVLDFVYHSVDERNLMSYLAKADIRGRTAAHYLFNAPQLMSKLANKLPWRQKDRIGQTPLFALCRSYDHANYLNMVSEALIMARDAQDDGLPLRLEDHMDNKGNTLLHIVNDPLITRQILHHCDADPNAVNDKRFTPLMLASKYGRVDMVRVFFGDPRVDLHVRELRGLTAVELAKDDEVRNRIDDLTLFSNSHAPTIPDSTGRITSVVRSFFVEDGSIRFILKSGAPSDPADLTNTTYTITTCRRSFQDFENLSAWLAQDHPASYLPSLDSANFRFPFQIHSRPSRAILNDTQTSLDRFLKILLAHPTFSTHEMLWEFFLVPDMQSDQMAERAKLKAQLLAETISDEHEPIENIAEVQQLITHSRDMVGKVSSNTRAVIRHGHNLQHADADLADALTIATAGLSTLGPPADMIPKSHVDALTRYATLMTTPPESSPLLALVKGFTSFHSTILAIQTALTRPSILIMRIDDAKRNLSRDRQNLNSQSLPRKFQFPGTEVTRIRGMRELVNKIVESERLVEQLGKELRYTREIVVGELAGWTEWREKVGRQAIRGFVAAMVVREREGGKGLERCLRSLREANQVGGMIVASSESG